MTAAGLVGAAIAAGSIALLSGGGQTDDGGGAEHTPAAAENAALVAGMSPGELAGQRLIAGWDGTEPPAGLERLIRSGGVAGVILFDDNIGSRAATRRRIDELQRLRPTDATEAPLLVTVDQEGGQVERVPGPPSASAAEMGARGRGYARRQGERTGRSLSAWGFNVDLAPVLDVGQPGGAISTEGRSFGTTPARVASAGVGGFAVGLRSAGIAATAKHFPGIGMVATNTDFASQRVTDSRSALRRRDEPPFRAFVRSGGELVMLGLATYTAFSDRPAAFSRAIATGELRGRLGFEGVSISDGLGAAAAQDFGSDGEIALAAAGAGTDLLLYTDWREARSARILLRDRLATGRLDRAAFERSVARVLALRAGRNGPAAEG